MTWIILHNIFEGTYCLVNKSDLLSKEYIQFKDDIIIIRELPIGITEDEAHDIYIDFLDIVFPSFIN